MKKLILNLVTTVDAAEMMKKYVSTDHSQLVAHSRKSLLMLLIFEPSVKIRLV